MALVATVGGVDRTSVVKYGSLAVEQQAANFITVCSLTLIDEAGDIAIAAEDAITLVDGGTTFFTGRVVEVRYSLFTVCSRFIKIKCQDLNYQLIETVIDGEEVFTAEADADIIDSLFDDYLPAVDSETFVATIQDPLTITVGPCTIRSALSQIATHTGGYFYVDFDNKIHYFTAEADTVAWWLSDVPDQIDSFSYFEASLDKTTLATTRLDGVFVIGADVSGWRGTHGAGDRQGIARDNRITTATGVQNRGDAVLARYGDAQVTYTVKTYKAGLRAGMDVRFICALYDVDDTFTVRKMVIKWDECGDAYYVLTLGDVVNPALIGERNWTDALEEALGPITAPMLPTSSRGWIHDIVFIAADFDTVTWAGAKKITLADGTEYTINAGTTGNMEADTVHYIYLDIDTSEIALQVTHASATAVGSHKLLIAVAAPVADEDTNKAILQVFGGEGIGVMITADNIVAETITGNEINANAIAAGHIVAGAVETDKLDALAVTAAKIAANTITADKIEMGLGDALFNNADGLLLLGPHCEISPTEWWSLRRQKATLSGAFHQEAGRWMGTKGLVVEEATTNRILNPSIETNTTGWDAGSAAISRDAIYSVFGDYALKIITDNIAFGEGASALVTAETAANTEYTLSVWLRGSGTVQLWIWDTADATQLGPVITLTDQWTRHQMTATFGAGAVRRVGIGTDIQQAITYYCDGFQLEASAYATSYCDGSLGTGYAWTGAAHGSTSTRTLTEVNLDAHAELAEADSTQSFRIVVQAMYDYDVEWPTDFPPIVDIYEDANNRIYILFNSTTNRLNATIVSGGVTALLISGATTPFSAGDWLDIVLTVNFATDTYKLYLNGEEIATSSTVLGLIAALSQWNLGSGWWGGGQGGWNIAEFAAFSETLTAIEVMGMYALQRPMVDMGALDKPGIYLLDGQFKIASSTTGNRIEITADEIAGYDSGGTKQFYLQASDGAAMAGAGNVILDVTGLYMIRSGAAGTREALRWIFDDAGTHHEMGRAYGSYAGAGNVEVWLRAHRGAGEPWAGSAVQIQALDDVAATDVRITVLSTGWIQVGGTNTTFAGAVRLDDGELRFNAASADNMIKVPGNVADALHIRSDGEDTDYISIVTSDGAREVVINQDMHADIDFRVEGTGATHAFFVKGSDGFIGINMSPTANGIVCVGLGTENLELIDAGSIAATEQDWIEVEVGGVRGFIHVFAGK